MKTPLLAAALAFGLALPAASAHAQSPDHSAHTMATAAGGPAPNAQEISGAEALLVAYRDALTARDAKAMTDLFAQDSAIFENGKAEGSFANYMEHHLGPELAEIASFTFGRPTVTVTTMGRMAYGRETYTYRIELSDGRVIDREGAATSVLMQDDGGWKIVQYHSSSRAPRK
ncbi:conserved hypothetical protein [Altererythrobacter sp. B11]|uniref:YybH family protein n=1 Tax=Altererythrobacter sp. B11 TaxID=2060312 RepID=UPI000DC702C5|nr:nuclear transport factor 2 family protein [Altererythrobacter sp. B11]BBC71671.1 conserved hypothetical protein [Altererythrobacter sp. B11]